MSSVVFAQPFTADIPDVGSGWVRFGLLWTGWDGSVWNLRDVAGGVFVTTAGLLGLHFPEFEVHTSSSPARAGRRRRSVRTRERTASLPIYLRSDDGSREWLLLYRAFMHAFHPEKPGTLAVQTELGTKTLQLYFDSAGDQTYNRDPVWDGWSRYTMNLTAEDKPYWMQEPITYSWGNAAPVPFFGTDGNLHISESSSLQVATMSNPGDVSAWPLWKITSTEPTLPIQATITVDGGTIVTPNIGAGQTLTIDTDTGECLLNGVDVAGSVNPWDPRAIPAGGSVPLSLALTGYGTVSATITPRDFGAF